MNPLGKLSFLPSPASLWTFEVTPDLTMRLKRIFPRLRQERGSTLRIKHAPDIAADIEWVLQRYPLEIEAGTFDYLRREAAAYREKLTRMDAVMTAPARPGAFPLAFPPRDYQALGAALYLEQGYLLLADMVGLGKTITAIATFTDPRTLPALVVVKAHLPKQWRDEIARFLPGVRVHIIKSSAPYELPPAEVYIVTYSKLAGQWGALAEKCRSVVFDEIQELRLPESKKYEAAESLTAVVPFRLGLSATPIYNYGSEAWSVFNLLCPGALGSKSEFEREWCGWGGVVSDPDALGSYLRNQKMMLRRTRKEIGRELPPIIRYVQEAEFDAKVYEQGISSADALARLVLTGTFLERGQAARQFDLELRQATGLAKAPFVAELVRMLVESGEQVFLGGWHRAVYDVWRERLKDLNPVFFTGSESPAEKEAAKQAFIEGRSKVLIMSLRSGAGTNGLQDVCSVAVLGEMDWSPAVHEQFIGRLARDGQDCSVQVFIPVAPVGCDPTMASVLGLKQAQATGIVDMGAEVAVDFVETDPQRLKQLAKDFLKSRGITLPEPAETLELVSA